MVDDTPGPGAYPLSEWSDFAPRPREVCVGNPTGRFFQAPGYISPASLEKRQPPSRESRNGFFTSPSRESLGAHGRQGHAIIGNPQRSEQSSTRPSTSSFGTGPRSDIRQTHVDRGRGLMVHCYAEGTRTPTGASYQPLNVTDRVYLRTYRPQPGMRRFTKEATGWRSHKDLNLGFQDVQQVHSPHTRTQASLDCPSAYATAV